MFTHAIKDELAKGDQGGEVAPRKGKKMAIYDMNCPELAHSQEGVNREKKNGMKMFQAATERRVVVRLSPEGRRVGKTKHDRLEKEGGGGKYSVGGEDTERGHSL